MAIPPLQAVPDGTGLARGMDYAALKDEGVKLAQAYSGSIWTDYNEHDPGVTILEQLCYVLTELSYRATLPVADLLAAPGGQQNGIAEIFHRPSRILPAEPATQLDYRRLLIDRVPGLANVWLDPVGGKDSDPPTGLYDMRLYAAPAVPGVFERASADPRMVERARRLFVRHRALCEDIGSLRLIEPVRTVVSANVTIERSIRPELAMAEIVQNLACYLAPEPRRRQLRDLAGEGRSLAEIFEGPLAINGFIDPADLGPQRLQVATPELHDQIARVAGVLDVDELHLWVEPGSFQQARIEPNSYFSLDSGLDSDLLPIRLIVDGHACPIDTAEVRRLLNGLWREHRQTWRLGPECGRLYPSPQGHQRPLGDYTPVASHFPAVYGVGGQGLPRDASPGRRALARQLEAYLALFDRQMVDYLDRLVNLRSLFALDPIDQEDLARPLVSIAPQIAALLIDGGPDADALEGRATFPIDQQNRIADFLLALYGEDPDALIPIPPRGGRRQDEASRRLAIKRALLERLVSAGKGRGRGMDYDGRRSRRRFAGVELRSRIMLGGETHRGGRTRPRMSVVEHVLLRPRSDGGCAEGAPADDAMTITAVVHLPWDSAGRGSRRQVEAMIRANTPAHVRLRTFFVDRDRWVRFRRLHRLWREALGEDMPEAIDCVSAELRRRFDLWAAEDE